MRQSDPMLGFHATSWVCEMTKALVMRKQVSPVLTRYHLKHCEVVPVGVGPGGGMKVWVGGGPDVVVRESVALWGGLIIVLIGDNYWN